MLFKGSLAPAPSSDTPLSSFAVKEDFRLKVLGPDEFTVACRLQEHVDRRRLIVRLSDPVAPGACVRIDGDDAILLGEFLGSWRQGPAIFGIIQLHQGLGGLAGLRSICDDFGSSREAGAMSLRA